MPTIFERNEKIKEILVMECSAFEAKSKYFKDGVLIIPEPFLETTVRWHKDVETKIIEKAIKILLDFRDEISKNCTMTNIQYEISYGHPQIIWVLFEDDENLFEY